MEEEKSSFVRLFVLVILCASIIVMILTNVSAKEKQAYVEKNSLFKMALLIESVQEG